ncbi:MAG: hypothetical protein ABW134_11645 [Candidatus Thiodiazotropha endolucinida]
MNFESKIGIGEICGYNEEARRGNRRMEDVLVKVVAVTFDSMGVHYTCEHIGGGFGVQRFTCYEPQLHGDPDFDQESGKYPE